MKTIELFCASPSSTAICSSMDQRAIVRPIERRLGETPKSRTNGGAPCSSQLPLSPAASSCRVKTSSRSNNYYYKQNESRRKSSADVDDIARLQRLQISSSRYLLSHEKPQMMDFDNNNNNTEERAVICSQPLKENNYRRLSTSDAYPVFRSLSSTRANYKSPLNKSSSLDDKTSSLPLMSHDHHLNVDKVSSNRQVVELRVSIHCKGCEGKLRKHISRMEGVTSYSIDLATKKVTVIGDVTPLGVLTSISKVKNAQFWPSPTSSSSSSTSSSPSPRIGLKR
ncbi:hypothetical protein ACJIZ3_012599 [Penstemon smallii]|uniref:HMA domain-containing protein n=1 Tax=Penstemon smallii TaxID=265156 RepID=A0ABD3UR40_9LAMI